MLSPKTKISLIRIFGIICVSLLFTIALGISNNFFVLRTGITVCLFVLSILSFFVGYKSYGMAGLIVAIAYNPVSPIHEHRYIWSITDILLAGAVIYLIYWTTNPYQKGTRFEQYVSTLFPEPDFIIHDRTRDVSKFLGRRVETDLHPDFIFRDRRTNKTFAIECKWRSRWAKNKENELGLWWNMDQGARYNSYGKEFKIPVFIALGVGGTPEKPKEVYFIESTRIQYPFLKQPFIRAGKSLTQVKEIFF